MSPLLVSPGFGIPPSHHVPEAPTTLFHTQLSWAASCPVLVLGASVDTLVWGEKPLHLRLVVALCGLQKNMLLCGLGGEPGHTRAFVRAYSS